MKLKIHPTVLFRTPRYPTSKSLSEVWESLKLDISYASPEFHQHIKHIPATKLASLHERTKFTIWKYFNRARFRCIPFGSFAAIGYHSADISTKKNQLLFNEEINLKTFRDLSSADDPQITLDYLITHDLVLFSNSSYYPVKENLRFLAFADKKFELGEVERSTAIELIVNLCAKKIRYSVLISSMTRAGYSPLELPDLIISLIEAQLILTEHHRNILGEDYFERLKIRDRPSRSYLIATRIIQKATINDKLANTLLKMAGHLHQLCPPSQTGEFTNFISSFTAKFGLAELQLVHALDPEIGIGYGGLERMSAHQDLTDQLLRQKKVNYPTDDLQSGLKSFILNKITDQGVEVIQIDEIPGPENYNPLPLPNTFSLLLTMAGQTVVVDSIGGCTANAISGRFSIAGPEFEQFNISVARIEAEANPEILFFDVGYTAEPAVDNINRRKSVYPMALNILNYDITDKPLLINDLMVSVRNKEVVLRSKSLNKRLIPRISSAYNYQRSSLALFRFLCDLQNQDIQTHLLPDLETLLPGLDYYPRLQYKDIVLSPKKWKLNWQPAFKEKGCFLTFLKRKGISRLIAAGKGDQYLTFDLEKDEELIYLQQLCVQHQRLALREEFEDEGAVSTDQSGLIYRSQWQMTLINSDEIYSGAEKGGPIDSSIPPGNDWIYYQIYCHEQRSDQLLAELIQPFLIANKKHFKTWFFIRYLENGSHIRLRMQLKNPQQSGNINSGFSELLKLDFQAGIISDFSIRTYVPERARYGTHLIKEVEQHFCLDSQLVLRVIALQLSADQKYQLIHLLINSLAARKLFNINQITICEKICRNLEEEHHLGNEQFKILNIRHKAFATLPALQLDRSTTRLYGKFSNSLCQLISLADVHKKEPLFADLIHMHVNRLFSTDQRTHEMIVYYFLIKCMRSEIQRHRQQ